MSNYYKYIRGDTVKKLTKGLFKRIEFIPLLLKYFALSSENRVRCEGVFPGIWIIYYQADDSVFHRIVYNERDAKEDPEYEPFDFKTAVEVNLMLSIISQLPSLPATMEGHLFKTMEEQVRCMATAYWSLDTHDVALDTE